jgi:hypothetical protein
MSKVKIFKTEEMGDIPLKYSTALLVAFDNKYGKSPEVVISENKDQPLKILEPMIFMVFQLYLSGCYVLKQEPVYSCEDFSQLLSIEEIQQAVVLGFQKNEKTQTSNSKKK